MKSAYGVSIPEGLSEICNPNQCGLIIYDMQAGIVAQIEEGPQIVAACTKLLASARKANMRVFYTRHMFLPNQAAGVGQLKRAMIWQGKDDPGETTPLILQGDNSWQIVSELCPLAGDVVIDKITMSAFESTFLNLALRDAQLKAFIIVGIAIEVGIEPTVRHGADLNFIPVVVSDACGSKSQELKHRSLSTLMEIGEVIFASVADVCSNLSQ